MIAADDVSVAQPAAAIGCAASMKAARRWLLADAVKVPYYVDGRKRQGTLDADADRAALATYTEAQAALAKAPDGWLLGFALGPDGEGFWQGIDLDKIDAIVTRNASIIAYSDVFLLLTILSFAIPIALFFLPRTAPDASIPETMQLVE